MLSISLIIIFTSVRSKGQELLVPQDYSTIQSAIDNSSAGDTVLVDTGTYFENINFGGKDIVVSSYYRKRDNFDVVFNTIIDGGQPSTDTTNVITFRNGETENAKIEGFTIRNGKAFLTVDDGVSAEGGGIHIFKASPEVKFNFITQNSGTKPGQGGGGISASFSSSFIHNNIFFKNIGGWAGAFVENNSKIRFRNNLVIGNTSTAAWGGIVLFYKNPDLGAADTSYCINNTIVGNINDSYDIGVLQSAHTYLIARNNIVNGNANRDETQLSTRLSGILDISYSMLSEGDLVEGNITGVPTFITGSCFLDSLSTGVDGGDPDSMYSDVEDSTGSGIAKVPSQGTTINDIGYTGGPLASVFTLDLSGRFFCFDHKLAYSAELHTTTSKSIKIYNLGAYDLDISEIRDVNGSLGLSWTSGTIGGLNDSVLAITWKVETMDMQDTIFIYHNDSTQPSPFKIIVTGKGIEKPNSVSATKSQLISVYPNPADDVLHITMKSSFSGKYFLYDNAGRILRSGTVPNANNFEIDIADFNNGIYFLELKNGKEDFIKKLVVLK